MSKNIPLALVFVLGLVFVIQFFIPSKPSMQLYNWTLEWEIVIGLPAIVIGIDSLVRHHVMKIRQRKQGWAFSFVYLGSALGMAVVGFIPQLGGVSEGGLFMNLFSYCIAPMTSTVFALLAFYMTSAAYRAFRARTTEATLLLAAAFIVMLGLLPLSASIWKGFPYLTEWLMIVPNMASKRGITFGIGLGMAATTLKIMLGIERNWMGGA
ncbi:MAG: hypothetical protein QME74_07310 [Candidatus Edwardsbacteria bacterium]|nr:hypothetical protein [Candidatus Edwardsbacteria bacterium]